MAGRRGEGHRSNEVRKKGKNADAAAVKILAKCKRPPLPSYPTPTPRFTPSRPKPMIATVSLITHELLTSLGCARRALPHRLGSHQGPSESWGVLGSPAPDIQFSSRIKAQAGKHVPPGRVLGTHLRGCCLWAPGERPRGGPGGGPVSTCSDFNNDSGAS